MKPVSFLILLFLFATTASTVHAQISLSTAVDLALRNSMRVKVAEAEVAKAKAIYQESRNVYIPALSAGSGLGYTYGFPVGTPTLFNFTVQSLAFDMSQRNYIRSAQHGLDAAQLSLQDIRQQIAEDTAVTYLAIDTDQRRMRALNDQNSYADHLVSIVETRMDAGQDTHTELTKARLTAAQIRLRRVQIADDLNTQRGHLSRLTALPADQLITDENSIPAPPDLTHAPSARPEDSYSVRAADATAQAKLQQAFGDERKVYRPQIAFAGQYARFASFNNYSQYYCSSGNPSCQISNNVSFGIQLIWPIFDFTKRAKGRESMAEAQHAMYEAQLARDTFLDNAAKNTAMVTELQARSEVVSLQRDLAKDQLDAIRVQINSGTGSGPVMTPKDEQNAQVQERQKYLDYLDADFQLRQAQIEVMRTNGQLDDWLKPAANTILTPQVQR